MDSMKALVVGEAKLLVVVDHGANLEEVACKI
jgi:hypothetical protein